MYDCVFFHLGIIGPNIKQFRTTSPFNLAQQHVSSLLALNAAVLVQMSAGQQNILMPPTVNRYHPPRYRRPLPAQRVSDKPFKNAGVKRRPPSSRVAPHWSHSFKQCRSTGHRLHIRPRVKQTPAAKTSSRITDRR